MTIPYSYGGFLLHDNLTFFMEAVDLSWVDITQVMTKIARMEGMKKSGESQDDRKVKLTVAVMPLAGTRAALEAALDTLDLALYQRQQPLVLHGDGRYFVADCVSSKRVINHPSYVAMELDFECQQPFAYAPAPSSSSATLFGLGSNPYTFTTAVTGGGTVFSRPTITITNVGTPAISNLVLTNQTDNTVLSITALTLNAGDYVTIVCDPLLSTNNGYLIYKNGSTATLYDFSGVFPVLDTGTSTWQLQGNAASAPLVTMNWSWTNRYLG